MINQNIRIAIVGSKGKMAKMLIKNIINHKQILLKVILEKNKTDLTNHKIKKILGNKILDIKIQNNIFNVLDYFDTLIDFSEPKSTLYYLNICKKYKKSMIIGTTGFNKEEKKCIKNAAKKIPIIYSTNFSIGMNIIFKILKIMTKFLGKNYDIDIIDIHHKNKKDLPSGTTLEIDKTIREILKKKKIDKKINSFSIRNSNIVGEHIIMFSGMEERIKIKHEIFNRKIFVDGVIKGCLWIKNKKHGLYTMQNILNIDI
ncbi:MAG: 4-hydroxy-tetrahydrodipicolinate reductase [Arsenophonus sp.]|nr:MAG: 4-hydroxy-tetrahydrodipicolinate reductase [Arsenophonus sp.]